MIFHNVVYETGVRAVRISQHRRIHCILYNFICIMHMVYIVFVVVNRTKKDFFFCFWKIFQLHFRIHLQIHTRTTDCSKLQVYKVSQRDYMCMQYTPKCSHKCIIRVWKMFVENDVLRQFQRIKLSQSLSIFHYRRRRSCRFTAKSYYSVRYYSEFASLILYIKREEEESRIS